MVLAEFDFVHKVGYISLTNHTKDTPISDCYDFSKR